MLLLEAARVEDAPGGEDRTERDRTAVVPIDCEMNAFLAAEVANMILFSLNSWLDGCSLVDGVLLEIPMNFRDLFI